MQLFIGKSDRLIGRTAYVKTQSGYAKGVVKDYIPKTNRYMLKMAGGGSCYSKKIYLHL